MTLRTEKILRTEYPVTSGLNSRTSHEEVLKKHGFIVLNDVEPHRIATTWSVLYYGHNLLGDCTHPLPEMEARTAIAEVVDAMNQTGSNVLPVNHEGEFIGVVCSSDIVQSLEREWGNAEKKLLERTQALRVWRQRASLIEDISRRLHDGPAQYITALTYRISDIWERTQRCAKVDPSELRDLRNLCEKTTREIRRLMFAGNTLKRKASSSSSSVQDFQEIVELFNRSVRVECDDIQFPFSSTTKDTILHILREAIINAAKHSRAENIVMDMYPSEDHIIYRVIDNGIGFSPETVKSGLGLDLIKCRANEIGAQFHIESTPKETRCILRVPMKPLAYA